MNESECKKSFSLKYKIWLVSADGEGVIGDGRWKLLTSIEKNGSLKAAAEELGISYRKAWGDLRSAEKKIGCKLIERHRGGKDGGKSLLTPMGIKLTHAYTSFHLKVEDSLQKAFKEFTNIIKNDLNDSIAEDNSKFHNSF